MAKRTLSKLKVAEGVNKLPTAKARPGDWRKALKPPPLEDKVNKHTEVPIPIQDAIVQQVADGVPISVIEARFEVSVGYVRSVMLRKFGSLENMKSQLTLMSYENAMAFFGYAASKIDELSPAQAVLAGKLSIDSGLALEKSTQDKPETIDFAGLMMLGQTLARLEKSVAGTDRTLPATGG